MRAHNENKIGTVCHDYAVTLWSRGQSDLWLTATRPAHLSSLDCNEIIV